jgi:predicted deacylase
VEAPAPAPAPVDDAPLFTTEEQETLTNYERDWPEVVAGQALRERKLAVDIVQHIFNQLAPVLRPILDSTTAMDTREYLSTLEAQVPDYRQIRDNVEAWALDEKHPPYLRAAYQHVIQEGTADEVVDLISRYRMEVGGVAPAAPARKPADTELPAATKKAVASLAPVSSKRSVVTGAHDPLDFDGAFSKFADNA